MRLVLVRTLQRHFERLELDRRRERRRSGFEAPGTSWAATRCRANRGAGVLFALDDTRAVMGRWGYFEDTVRLGALRRRWAAASDAIYVDNGSLLSMPR